MTRILTLTNWYPPHHRGGYEIVCRDVMIRMKARGHDVEVLCGDDRLAGVADESSSDIRVRRELRLYWRDENIWKAPIAEQLHIESHNQLVLARALDEFKPDVVSVWHMAALSLNLLTTLVRRGIPVVYAICDDWTIFASELDPWSGHWQASPVRRLVGQIVERIIHIPTVIPDIGVSGVGCFVSNFTRSAARLYSPWVFRHDAVVYSGIDRSRLGGPAEHPRQAWEWRIAYFGRFDRRKGIDTLIRALAQLPAEASLVLHGRGGEAERARLTTLSVALKVDERIQMDCLDPDELGEAYRQADCVVFPSEWAEPFGLVPLEAMACGTPVVATGVAGSQEFLVDGVNCLLFPPGDAGALAKAIASLAESDELRGRLRESGFATAEAFDIERTADGFELWLLMAADGRLPEGESVDGPVLDRATGEVATGFLVSTGPRPTERAHAAGTHDSPYTGRDLWVVPVPLGQSKSVLGRPLSVIGNAEPSDTVLSASHLLRFRLEGRQVVEVAADLKRLPFRAACMEAAVCEGVTQGLQDDTAGVAELRRVLKPSATAVLATANRHNAFVLRDRARDWWRGRKRPLSFYFASKSHTREYTWKEFEALVVPEFYICERIPVGWMGNRRRRVASRFLVGPARRVSRMIVLEVRPR